MRGDAINTANGQLPETRERSRRPIRPSSDGLPDDLFAARTGVATTWVGLRGAAGAAIGVDATAGSAP